MRFAVVTLGSAGDLHPFLAIARELAQRGHEVHLLSQAPYQDQVEREGVRFRAIVSASHHERTLTHPLLWHPIDGFGVLWRHLCVPAIEGTCEALGELVRSDPGPLTVFASPLAAGARFARDRWPEKIRLLTGYTAPMGLRDTDDPMFLGGWQVPGWLPTPVRRSLWRALDRWKLEPMARPTLDRWRRVWHTPPISGSVFGDWLHSPDGGLALYPDWFAAVPQSWQARGVAQSGFPVFEPRIADPLPNDLLTFLKARDKPVVVYPGSAAGTSGRFLDLVWGACLQMGVPAVVLAPHLHADLPRAAAAPEHLITVRQATLSLLLPRCSVFVHHGGIGSAAQGLAHHTPQIVLASAYDQFENGARIAQLSQGRSLALRAAKPNQVIAELHAVVFKSETKTHATPKVNGAAAIVMSCDWLESRPQ